MSLVERWWLTDYASDIYVYLRSREKQRLNFRCRSPQLHLRKDLVSLIENTCKKLGFCILVQHLAVHLLDIFMDGHNVEAEQLQLIALGCTIVAAKAEEKDAIVPKNSEFNERLDTSFDPKDLARVELAVLSFFNWEVHHPTVAHFLDYFAVFAIFPADYAKHADSVARARELQLVMRNHLGHFLDATLKDHAFMQMPASLVAAACVACSRLSLFLSPLWSKTLESVSAYKLEQLFACTNRLLPIPNKDGRTKRNDAKRAAVQAIGRNARPRLEVTLEKKP